MRLTLIAGLVVLAWMAGLPNAASAMQGRYAREHPDYCAKAWEEKSDGRTVCGNRAFCAVHKNDDRISRIVCDPYVSQVNPLLPSVTISQGGLNAARNLTEAETRSECQPDGRKDHVCAMSWMRKRAGESDDRLLPAHMKTAKLALRADLSVYLFPTTVVRLGIGAGISGLMKVSWNLNGNGARTTQSTRLNPAEIDRLLVALNKSDFWRLPHEGRHMGGTDGEVAAVEVSVPGMKDEAMDIIGDSEAVDLSVLVNAISQIIRDHWRNVPA